MPTMCRVGAVLVFALTSGFWTVPPGALAQDVSGDVERDASDLLNELGLVDIPGKYPMPVPVPTETPEHGIGGFPETSDHGTIPPPDNGGIHVGVDDEGQPVAFLDIFSWKGNERVKEATWIMKIPVGLTESIKTTGKHAKQNPWWWVAGGLAAWEVADGGVSSLIDDITGSDTNKKLASADVVVVGDNVKLQDVSQSSTLSIKASTVDIDFQQNTGSK